MCTPCVNPNSPHQFAHRLAGLIEGAGEFSATGLTITFRRHDIEQAKALQKQLNLGKLTFTIYNVLLCINDPNDLAYIVGLLNGKLVGTHIIYQLAKYRYDKKYGIDLFQHLGKVSLQSGWLSGFLDEKLKFVIKTSRKTRKIIQEPTVEFVVSEWRLHSQGYLGYVKNIFDLPNTVLPLSIGLHAICIQDPVHIEMLITYLDTFPLHNRKVVGFRVIKDCATLIKTKENWSQEDVDLIELYKLKLTEVYEHPAKDISQLLEEARQLPVFDHEPSNNLF
jgi:hypothetical protein